jgi:hypothetical protein
LRRAILASVIFALVVMTASCSLAPAGYTPPTSPSSPSETLMLSPSSASVRAGSMQTFVPSLAGKTFTWSVNGIAGGNPTMGTIDANGNYVVPAPVAQYNHD